MGLIQLPTLDPSIQSAPPGGSMLVMADNTSFPRIVTLDSAGNPSIQLNGQFNAAVAQQTGFASDTYLIGSSCKIPIVGKWRAGSIYKCNFEMTKTAAGVAAPTVIIRMGTLGNISDAAVLTLTWGAGSAVADVGLFELLSVFRVVGSGTSAVIQAVNRLTHQFGTTAGGAGTGLTTSIGTVAQIKATSSGFNSTTQNFIGVSFNGGASFSGTCDYVDSILSL